MSRSLRIQIGRGGRQLLYGTRGVARAAARVRPRACVLLYHRVAWLEADPFGQAVAPTRFGEQLEAVRETYPIVSAAQLIAGLHDADYPDGAVAITFDDGYADSLTGAYPAAAALEIPIHVFVTAGPVAGEEPVFWWDELARLGKNGGYGQLHDELRRLPARSREARISAIREEAPSTGTDDTGRPLTRTEVAELARLPFATVGAHTVTHSALSGLTEDEQLFELSEGRRLLEALIEGKVDVLAYPFGKETDVSDTTRRLAAEAGYSAAFLSEPRAVVPSSDRFALPRLAVHDWPAGQLLERIGEVLGPLRSSRPRRRQRDGVVYHGGRARRAVALTFDDGPSEWTPELLEILRTHDARATFFVLGSAVAGREDTLRQALNDGHELGNHLYDHHDARELSDDELVEQLERGRAAVAEAVGTTPRLVRPPYGRDRERVAHIASARGIGVTIMGSIDPSDWRATSPEPIVRHVLRAVRPGAIVFLHDGVPPPDGTAATRTRAATVEAVAQLVPELQARGYELVTVSELLR